MKDFFERQDAARKKTGLLIFLFGLAVLSIIFCVYAVVSFTLIASVATETRQHNLVMPGFWSLSRFAIVSLGTLIVIVSASIYKIHQLGGGGKSVALMLGGRPVPPNSTNPHERRLLNVVEEMAIASGVPVPDVYVMDHESAINAFAAGFSLDDAVIAVTKGTLMTLTRDELQGVVAHEFSHILNADTLINIRLMGMLHGILVIALAGRALLRGGRYARGRKSGGAVGIGIALFVIGYVGLFFGNLIKSAVSRQREFLADASAVQFTRNPGGIAGALKKIGGQSQGSILLAPAASQASHMFISDAIGNRLFDLMATHPPLEERIKCIEPTFDGTFPPVKPLIIEDQVAKLSARKASQLPQGALSAVAVAGILETVGAPMQQHAERARSIMQSMPEELAAAAHDPSTARAIIYMLLFDKNKTNRDVQLAIMDDETSALTMKLHAHRQMLPRAAHLALVDLCLPSLRRMSREQYNDFKRTSYRLISADNKLTIFEYIIISTVIRKLDSNFLKPKHKVAQIYSINGLLDEAALVLSFLSRIGGRSDDEAQAAFNLGKEAIGYEISLLPNDACSLNSLDKALQRLNLATPKIKHLMLAACLSVITSDNEMSIVEVEIFRAVADSLGCPVPPWLEYHAS